MNDESKMTLYSLLRWDKERSSARVFLTLYFSNVNGRMKWDFSLGVVVEAHTPGHTRTLVFQKKGCTNKIIRMTRVHRESRSSTVTRVFYLLVSFPFLCTHNRIPTNYLSSLFFSNFSHECKTQKRKKITFLPTSSFYNISDMILCLHIIHLLFLKSIM